MKQPSLGIKIAGLRKAKGITQEELVERCNLNVRTLQRIEAGEVQPRLHTIKALFEALDHSWEEEATKANSETVSPIYIYLGMASGILYFFLAYFDIAMEIEWMGTDEKTVSYPLVLIKVFTFLTYTGFILGWLILEKHFPNFILRIALWVMIGSNLIWYCLDLFAIFSRQLTMESYYLVKVMGFGAAYAFLGAGYLGYGAPWGSMAKVIGALGLIAGIFLFSGIGVILGLVPLTLFELGQIALMVWGIKWLKNPPFSPLKTVSF
ncbi:helix-turn-helix domain-containing protein [Cyclobacterium jeungdonense]|uniref:Helix-turn-helix transcriptional regulator n=1 Tax=Cyclobacterium jeungdonense TaxID=708087 RepID=A0ABT8C6R1_9BACT|nr:helix-turn-helix transcriptional regulator [Cyclobacterium jeungdonense]MDN3688494.1 helix-turn-helix transcriptional regulator [Cyclobacterium jeungdonense]